MSVSHLDSLGRRFLEIEYDAPNGWIHVSWRGRLSTEDVLLGCEYVLTTIRQTNCPNLLNDHREVTAFWPRTTEWIVQQMMPQAHALGLRRFAHVVAPGHYGHVLAEELLCRISHRFETGLFDHLADAQAWLHHSPQSRAHVLEEAKN